MSVKKVKSKHHSSGYAFLLDLRLKGMKRIRQTFPSERLAKDAETVIRADWLRKKFNLPTESNIELGELVMTHINKTVSRRPKNTWIKNILYRFRDLVGASTLVEAIRTADFRDYVELREAAGVMPQSINREVVEVKSCLSAAKEYYRSLEDWQPPKAVWCDETHDGRERVWSDDEFFKVLDELYAPKRPTDQLWHVEQRHALGDMFVVLSQTALRPGEACRLKKSDVNFSEREITIVSRKGIGSRGKAKTRKVPMTDEVFEILKRRCDSVTGVYLFPNRDKSGAMVNYTKTMREVCERAEINWGQNIEGGVTLRDMRRTAENKMLDAGFNAKAVIEITGHSPETLAKHYARASKQQKHDAIKATGFQVRSMDKNRTQQNPTVKTNVKAKAKKDS